MADEDSPPQRRGPEWFLEKIAAGLDAAGIAPPEPPATRRKLSRAEIERVVSETVREELARLDAEEPAPDQPPE
jgi:hypothetical protein